MIANPVFVRAIAQRGVLPAEEVQDVIGAGGSRGDASRLLRYLIHRQKMRHEDAMRLWADSFGVACIDLDRTLFQVDVMHKLPKHVAQRYRMMLVYQLGGATTAAMANPLDREAIGIVTKILGLPLSVVCADPDQIDHAIEVQYHSFTEFSALKQEVQLTSSLSSHEQVLTRDQLEQLAGQEAVVRLVQTLLLLGVKENASDIHVEPQEGAVLVRFRVDGTLHERTRLSYDVYPQFLSRVKILSGMDITERRRPQDGRISLQTGARMMDYRVSVVPSLHGETIALRILGQLGMRAIPALDELDMSRDVLDRVRQAISVPNGVFLVTGPTGCGKTTTIFSLLREINVPGINIMTVEDPVEYRLAGITQVPVNRAAGVGFPEVLRTFLRQDPDVLLIGEIRDRESARIATEAALTGHLVLSSLHTNDAVQATLRLVDIGVEPFMVAPTLVGVMAQRLVRAICVECKEAYVPEDAVLERLFERDPAQPVHFYRGRGCAGCGHSGYRGRLALHEVLIIDDVMRQLIGQNQTPIAEAYKAAAAAGYRPMHYDGLKKVLRGLTTIGEVERNAYAQT